MNDWLATLYDELQARGGNVVRVVVANVRGSAPREPGACMLVRANGEIGTIGGGHLELVATRIARDMLDDDVRSSRLDRFALGASLGQCCGGIVELWFQRYRPDDLPLLAQALKARADRTACVIAGPSLLTQDDAMRAGARRLDAQDAELVSTSAGPLLYERIDVREIGLWLFGAGHVARHLVSVIAPLPFAIRWVDSREGMIPESVPRSVRAIETPDPAEEVSYIGPDDWALVMTHSHDEDFAICQALLRHGRFGWAGVIGSKPKATRFRQRLAQRGFAAADIARLVMPIGIGGIRGKEPASIAVAVAAQLLQLRDARAQAPGSAVRES